MMYTSTCRLRQMMLTKSQGKWLKTIGLIMLRLGVMYRAHGVPTACRVCMRSGKTGQ